MVTKTVTSKVVAPLATRQGLLPTPPIPEDLPRVELTENARQVLVRRYVRRGEDGEPVETPEEMFWRVAYHIAKAEEAWGGDVMTRAREFYTLLTNKKFFPNSPTFTGAGTPLGQLAACFVLPITDDMGRDSAGIFQTLRDAALIQQTGGGNGFSFSRLRPKGALVKSSAGQATGPVGFLRVYDHAFGEIAQGGTRRGANMGVLRVDHPDIEDFITCKTDENQITNFNISVGITDAFMRAVRDDAEWELRFPEVNSPEYRGLSGTLEQAEQAGVPIRVYRKVRARELFDKIVRQAHHNGEPGVLFLDAANRGNPMPHLYQLESTNPCVTGDTLIYTDDGLRRADELAAEAKEIKVVTDARFGTQTLMPASHVFSTGKKNVYRLMTRQGYELRLTENHQVMSSRGWVAAGDLKPGDRIHILNRKGGFGVQGTLEEGRVLGWMVGDGTVNAIRAVLSFFGDEKREPACACTAAGRLAPAFAAMVTGIVEKPGQRRAYPVGVTEITERDEARVSSQRLRDWIAHYGLRENKFIVPAAVLTGSEEIQRGFLQALFTADGQVSGGGEKGCSVRLSSSHLALLKDVQRLLLNFGIVSRIYENRRTGGYRPMPDGKGGSKEYFHLPQHDLAISKLNLIRFANEIGFLMEAKQTKLADYLNRMVRGLYDEPFLATVAAVEPDGCETVYDLHQPDAHSFIANGLVVHNCGEQFLGPYENCCLGSINLAEHCGAEGTVDWESLRRSVELSTRFLDDVVDANAYVPAVPQLKEAAHRARRIGLGIMGLADLMYHVGVRYGSAEGQEFGAQVMEFVRYHAMKTSIELAEERGPFPAIQNSIYDMEDMRWTPPKSLVKYDHNWGCPPLDWEEIVEGIRSHGIRNAAQTTVAPTGTIATVAGCEGYGCEPVFALAYVRHVNDNGKDLQLTYASPRFEAALAAAGIKDEARQKIIESVMEGGACQDIPEVPESIRHTFVVSADISAEEHVRMQAALQSFVDNGLSKCVTGDTLVLTAQGLVPIASLSEMRLPDQFESHDLTVISPNGAAYSDFFYFGGMRETRRVTLAHGFEIEGTPNHGVHVLQADGSIDFMTLDNLKIGDTVVLYMGQQVFGSEGQPLPAYTGRFHTVAKPICFPEKMSPELAYVLGCITSEGSIGQNALQICNGDRALLERLGQLFQDLFGLNSHITQDNRRESVYSLQVNSRPLCNWLRGDLDLEAGTRNKIIPDCILRASRHEIAAFLRGLFLDAYMTLNGRMFGIGLASRKLLHQLQILLLNFGVFSMIHRSAEHAWALNVSGEALEQLAAFVEFEEIWKNEHFQASATPYARQFFANDCEGLLYVNVQHIEAGFAEVFDISVPGSHSFIANGLCNHNTINFPTAATEADVAKAYKLAWELGCKGITVYVTGSREKVVLETKATAQKREGIVVENFRPPREGETRSPDGDAERRDVSRDIIATQLAAWHETKKPRPRALIGRTYRVETPLGKAFVTLNENGGGHPFEVFINTAKAGSETAAVSEAIGRLISYVLRLASPIAPRDRLAEVVKQLSGIGGGRSLGFGPHRVRSLPDGVGQVLNEYLKGETDPDVMEKKTFGNGHCGEETPDETPRQVPLKMGDLCPECGEATMVNEEGCRKCYTCGYSEC